MTKYLKEACVLLIMGLSILGFLAACDLVSEKQGPVEIEAHATDVPESAKEGASISTINVPTEEVHVERGIVACDAGGQVHEAPYLREIPEGYVGVDSKLEIRWYPKPQCKALVMTDAKQVIADKFAEAKIAQKAARDKEEAAKKEEERLAKHTGWKKGK